jgi:hypothetical protein
MRSSPTTCSCSGSSSSRERVFVCPLCDLKCYSKSGLTNHAKQSHPNNADAVVFLASGVTTPLNTIGGRSEPFGPVNSAIAIGLPFACDQCPQRFKYENRLMSHVNRVHRTCVKCRVSFATWDELVAHQNATHRRAHYRYECTRCMRVFPTFDDIMDTRLLTIVWLPLSLNPYLNHKTLINEIIDGKYDTSVRHVSKESLFLSIRRNVLIPKGTSVCSICLTRPESALAMFESTGSRDQSNNHIFPEIQIKDKNKLIDKEVGD